MIIGILCILTQRREGPAPPMTTIRPTENSSEQWTVMSSFPLCFSPRCRSYCLLDASLNVELLRADCKLPCLDVSRYTDAYGVPRSICSRSQFWTAARFLLHEEGILSYLGCRSGFNGRAKKDSNQKENLWSQRSPGFVLCTFFVSAGSNSVCCCKEQ